MALYFGGLTPNEVGAEARREGNHALHNATLYKSAQEYSVVPLTTSNKTLIPVLVSREVEKSAPGAGLFSLENAEGMDLFANGHEEHLLILDRRTGEEVRTLGLDELNGILREELGQDTYPLVGLIELQGRVAVGSERLDFLISYEGVVNVVSLPFEGELRATFTQLHSDDGEGWGAGIFTQFAPHGHGFAAEFADFGDGADRDSGLLALFFSKDGKLLSTIHSDTPLYFGEDAVWLVSNETLGTLSESGEFDSTRVHFPKTEASTSLGWHVGFVEALIVDEEHALFLHSSRSPSDGAVATLSGVLAPLSGENDAKVFAFDTVENRQVYAFQVLDYNLRDGEVLLRLHLVEEGGDPDEYTLRGFGEETDFTLSPGLEFERVYRKLSIEEGSLAPSEVAYEGRFPLLSLDE